MSVFLYLTELPTIFLLNGKAFSLSSFLKLLNPTPSISAAPFMSTSRGIITGFGFPCSAKLVSCATHSFSSASGITPVSATGRMIRLIILTVSREIFVSFTLDILSAVIGRGCWPPFFVKNNCCNPLYELY